MLLLLCVRFPCVDYPYCRYVYYIVTRLTTWFYDAPVLRYPSHVSVVSRVGPFQPFTISYGNLTQNVFLRFKGTTSF